LVIFFVFKKRQQKQQDLFDDDFDNESQDDNNEDDDGEDDDEDNDDDENDDDDDDSEDFESDSEKALKTSIKMEADDDYEFYNNQKVSMFDEDDEDESNESNMTATTANSKSTSSRSMTKKGGSKSCANSYGTITGGGGGGGGNGSASSSYVNSDSLFDLMMSSKNRDSFFWQYNIQSKGPKTKKALTLRSKDPHFHRDFFDPVFQLQTLNARTAGSASLNKLRKGDGNDVTPNAEKLYNLGNQIRDFIQKSYQMNSAFFTPQQQQAIAGGAVCGSPSFQFGGSGGGGGGVGSSNSANALSSSFDNTLALLPPRERMNLKREKNKIASRACRLKKKAQHEANKIKLSGLNEEHS
jgi:CREB3 regulatory factor